MSRINRVLVHNDVFHSKNFSAIVFHKCVSRAIFYVCILCLFMFHFSSYACNGPGVNKNPVVENLVVVWISDDLPTCRRAIFHTPGD